MISLFELYKIGIGPSSSHTVGPMKAANLFLQSLIQNKQLQSVTRIKCELFGSLGATGKGHSSDIAVMLGLLGEIPDTTDSARVPERIAEIREQKQLHLGREQWIDFNEDKDLILHKSLFLPYHPNAMTLFAYEGDALIFERTYYSIGGGFVLDESEISDDEAPLLDATIRVPYPFDTAEELLAHCEKTGLRICDIVLANEKTFHDEEEIYAQLGRIWQVMQDCVDSGCHNEGILPGGMNIKRRAPALYQQIKSEQQHKTHSPLLAMDWLNMYALAVNEENAAGGRVVTAPTNGAAGIIPAVMHYFRDFSVDYHIDDIYRFMMTAAAIGIIIKQNASISGAEVGCQGEVGSACAMAAAGLTEAFGGTPAQCTNAAEIGIEHNLGLTCDPIGGLVQVPCIERNAMAAVKAVNASRIARRGDGTHFVSLDKAIKTMNDTGKDMMDKYKETAQGGLAINVIEVPVNFVDC